MQEPHAITQVHSWAASDGVPRIRDVLIKHGDFGVDKGQWPKPASSVYFARAYKTTPTDDGENIGGEELRAVSVCCYLTLVVKAPTR